jgi:hypothetical protein
MASQTKKCSANDRHGRLEKARQFGAAASLVDHFAGDDSDLGDAFITLCVHAGIASADVICCARLGVHATGEDHAAAVSLLEKVDSQLAKDLRRLLGMKTRAGYSAAPSSASDQKAAGRAANRLVDAGSAIGPVP